jgi:hypothetical protein
MEHFLSRLRFLVAQNDSRHLNVAKTGALRISLPIESARHDRCGWLCCDDRGCNHRVVTVRVAPLTAPPAGKTADGASQSNEGGARFDAPPRCIYPIDRDRTATLRSQSRDRT